MPDCFYAGPCLFPLCFNLQFQVSKINASLYVLGPRLNSKITV